MKWNLLSTISIVLGSSLLFSCSGADVQKRDTSSFAMPIALPFAVANTVAKDSRPLVALKEFKIGGRSQRVRFYQAGQDYSERFTFNFDKLSTDAVSLDTSSPFSVRANTPIQIGKGSISDNNNGYGAVVRCV